MAKPRYNFNRIKAVLIAKGKTNKLLAKQLKMTETTVSTWCTNKRQPSVETIFEVAKYLKVDAGELLTPMANFQIIKKKAR
jgi:transcriptional regulator with XRE-family HTH domain